MTPLSFEAVKAVLIEDLIKIRFAAQILDNSRDSIESILNHCEDDYIESTAKIINGIEDILKIIDTQTIAMTDIISELDFCENKPKE